MVADDTSSADRGDVTASREQLASERAGTMVIRVVRARIAIS
jgi:hypothetical protein